MGYSINGPTKVITLTAGTSSVSVRDLWSRWVEWFLTSDNSKYLPAFVNVGGNDIDALTGTKIPIYAFLMNGWKIKPQEANHTLNVSDGILLVNGGGDPFNNTLGTYTVRINYQQPVQAISFSTGGSTGPTAADIADAVWEEVAADHTTTGSFGRELSTITAEDVTNAVWDEDLSNHTVNGSAGNIVERMSGLSQHNYRIFNQVYDSNHLLSSCIIKLYRTSIKCNNDVDSFASYQMNATYNTEGLMTDYKMVSL